MLVTMTHLRWYQERNQPTWLHKVKCSKMVTPGKPQVSVHELINLQGVDRLTKSTRKPDDHEMHNLLHLIRLEVRNGTPLFVAVRNAVTSPHSTLRRKVLAARLLRRLQC